MTTGTRLPLLRSSKTLDLKNSRHLRGTSLIPDEQHFYKYLEQTIDLAFRADDIDLEITCGPEK